MCARNQLKGQHLKGQIISLGEIMEACLELGRAPAQSPETSFKVANMSGTAATAILASVQYPFHLDTNVMECFAQNCLFGISFYKRAYCRFVMSIIAVLCILRVIVLTNFWKLRFSNIWV